MFKLIVFIGLVLISAEFVLVTNARSGRIVGGTFPTQGQFPFIVSVRTSTGVYLCGGTLISKRWIVSNAFNTREQQAASTVVVVGTTHRTVGGTSYKLNSINVNPLYNPNTFVNDISLLQTTQEILFSNLVAAAVIGSAHVGVGVSLIAAGWGATVSGGTGSPELLFIRTTTISNPDCFARFDPEERGQRIGDSSLCTFTRVGEGTCFGDGGGPLVSGNILVGVISWSLRCALGFPDVNVRVSSHRTWIAQMSGL